MNYIECTINKSNEFKNSDEIAEKFSILGYNVLLIANEITANTNDTHYHVLIDTQFQEIEQVTTVISNLYEQTNIISRYVKNIHATILYFMKDGKYKTYNGYVIPEQIKKNKLDTKQLIQDIHNGNKYVDLVSKYGLIIFKTAYGVKQLINEIQQERR